MVVDLRPRASVLIIAVVKSECVVTVDKWWYMIVSSGGMFGWTYWGLELVTS